MQGSQVSPPPWHHPLKEWVLAKTGVQKPPVEPGWTQINYGWLGVVAGAVVLALAFGTYALAAAAHNDGPEVAAVPTLSPTLTPKPSPKPTPKCVIKGNISFETGEHIYHLPSDTYYSRTVIELDKGERYFCTEAEAVAAGWRHAKPPPPPYDPCDDYETQEQATEDGLECDNLPSEEEQQMTDDYGDDSGYGEE